MSNETHRHRHHHHRFQHQKLHIHERTTFLPMLCSRPSIKDVSFPKWKDPPASASGEPLSPKIGCMGQVKRNNKIVGIGFPSSSHRFFTSTSIVSPAGFGKYSKLKRLFSGKSLNANPVTVSSSATKCGRRVRGSNNDRLRNDENEASSSSSSSVAFNVENMDPPLPVIKKVQGKSEEESQVVDSLWKRRSGGLALKSLQLQQIHHPRHHLLHPTSV